MSLSLSSIFKSWRCSAVKRDLALLGCLWIRVGFSWYLLGRFVPVPGRGCLIILGSDENPSGVFSARDLRFRSLITFVFERAVGGSGFIVKISGAMKFRSWYLGLGTALKVGNTNSRNLQLANLALNKAPVVGPKYLIMDLESKPT